MALTLETKVMTAHVPLPLAQKVDELAGTYFRNQSYDRQRAAAAGAEGGRAGGAV